MKLEDINETVFQTLSPEVQQILIETSQTQTPVTTVEIVATTIIVLFVGMLLID